MSHHSVNNNTRMGLVISLCSNSTIDRFNPPELPQILDIRELYKQTNAAARVENS